MLKKKLSPRRLGITMEAVNVQIHLSWISDLLPPIFHDTSVTIDHGFMFVVAMW